MININELRINSLVLKENPNIKQNEICKIFCINGEDNCVSLERLGKVVDSVGKVTKISITPQERYIFPVNPVDIHCIESFLLTEELLLKCGFVYNADDCFDKQNIRLRILGNSISVGWGCEVGSGKEWHDTNMEIKFLHQLQNLYFAMTSKELDVNL
ncbi:hypothetical protein F3B42_14315 [Bacteroides ovatus]|jgi:hypothetical protein|nr:hypothetical protein F3B42_14315 [Bacteroides ovatus]KAA4680756.1 hypothetical protein F3B41_15605 [Bacteroides ovatus]DAP46207.1 MAG TPA: hypothetical protein [Caudoviricetes sp.]